MKRLVRILVILVLFAIGIYLFAPDSQDIPAANIVSTDQPGSYTQPLAPGMFHTTDYGRIRIEYVQDNANKVVREMNAFNRMPEQDQRWLLVKLSFQCVKPSGEICDLDRILFSIVSDQKAFYKRQRFVVLDNELSGRVAGGGEKSGLIGFILPDMEKPDLLFVSDLYFELLE